MRKFHLDILSRNAVGDIPLLTSKSMMEESKQASRKPFS